MGEWDAEERLLAAVFPTRAEARMLKFARLFWAVRLRRIGDKIERHVVAEQDARADSKTYRNGRNHP